MKAKQAACGTYSGYNRHRNAGEAPCDACRAASRLAARAYREKRNAVRTGPNVKAPRVGRPVRRLPPAPASFPRCRRGCGRLVWHFDLGLCGTCGHRGQGRAA